MTWFFYDSTGTRIGLVSGNTVYYYIYNLQGDVIALARASTGKIVAKYAYDAWGNCTVTNASDYTVGTKNPFRYRGYYFDSETGLYYLNSRYYSPEFGRFISADVFISTGQGLQGANMFAYCGNNPVMLRDSSGMLPVYNYNTMMADSGSGCGGGSAVIGLIALIVIGVSNIGRSIQDRIERTAPIPSGDQHDQNVYVLKDNYGQGEVRYVGRTNDPGRRANEHKHDMRHPERSSYEMTVVATGLSVDQARIIEQTLISAYTLSYLENARREVSIVKYWDLYYAGAYYIELLDGFREDELHELMRR